MVTLDDAGSARSWTQLYAPPPALCDVVEHVWLQRVPAEAGLTLRIVADASPHVLVHALRSGTRLVRVVGARAHWVDASIVDREWTVGLRLRPGALRVLTERPASELTDRGEALAAVLGGEGQRLVEQIADASPQETAAALVSLVEGRARSGAPDGRVAALAGALGRSRGGRRVRDLARSIGLAERTLRQRCADAIGLSPVRIARIGRLHGALALRLREPGSDWARIAVRSGYADQSHLIRDFGALLGESPARFVARADRDAGSSKRGSGERRTLSAPTER